MSRKCGHLTLSAGAVGSSDWPAAGWPQPMKELQSVTAALGDGWGSDFGAVTMLFVIRRGEEASGGSSTVSLPNVARKRFDTHCTVQRN